MPLSSSSPGASMRPASVSRAGMPSAVAAGGCGAGGSSQAASASRKKKPGARPGFLYLSPIGRTQSPNS